MFTPVELLATSTTATVTTSEIGQCVASHLASRFGLEDVIVSTYRGGNHRVQWTNYLEDWVSAYYDHISGTWTHFEIIYPVTLDIIQSGPLPIGDAPHAYLLSEEDLGALKALMGLM